ncbi:MAG: hypothetical protein Q9183_003553, partial [Haloplaca sp. 2 TL-2023]
KSFVLLFLESGWTPILTQPVSAFTSALCATMASVPNRVYEVGILLYDGADLLDFAGPHGVLSHVSYNNNPISPEHVFNIQLISAQEEVTASDPVTFKRHISIPEARKQVEKFDILIVPGGPPRVIQELVDANGPEYQFMQAYIHESKNQERILMSVCSGSFILAATGVLAGKTVTTHSLALDGLKDICQEATKKYGGGPTKVMKARYIDGGLTSSGMRIITTGGISCGFDGSLYLASLKTSESASNFSAMLLDDAQRSPWETPGLSPISRTTFDQPGQEREIDCVLLTDQSTDIGVLPTPITSFALPALHISRDDPLRVRNTKDEQESIGPFAYGPIPDVIPSDSSSTCSDGREGEGPDDVLKDLWSAKDVLDPLPQLDVKTWGNFHDKSFKEPTNAFVSEAGPRVFDAFLCHDGKEQGQGSLLQSDVVLSSLIQLALARDSLLFRYDEKEKVFKTVIEDMRMSGYSQESWGSLTYDFTAYGSSVRQAMTFARDVRNSKKASSTCIALASGINTILSALEARLNQPLADTQTVLGLQSLLEQPKILLKGITDTVEQVRSFGDDSIPSMLFNLSQAVECSAPWCRPVFDQLMVRVSQPWMDSAEVFLGLRGADGLTTTAIKSTVKSSRQLALLSTGGDSGASFEVGEQIWPHRPTFVSDELAKMLLETQQSLSILQESEPDNPLAHANRLSSLKPPSLQWYFTFEALDEIQAQTQAYESRVLQALKEFDASGTSPLVEQPGDGDLVQSIDCFSNLPSHLSTLLKQIEDPLPSTVDPNSSSLAAAVCNSLDSTAPVPHHINSPPLSLSATLSLLPLFSTQSRVLAHSTLKLLFRTHRLRFHLRLLQSYPLFANGPFLVRLSHALFDTSLSSAAYQKGRIRSTTGSAGLQLGARETWPPASSELRIALMGILTDSYLSSVPEKVRSSADGGSMNSGDLPGDLSFAIRHDMSDAELDKCMDAGGLEALDFLKIAFRPPKPLDAVITITALDKYDTISRLLLRGARVGFVVKELMQHRRGAAREKSFVQRFKIEARHFVTTVFGFFADSIAELWSAMEDRLDQIEEGIDCYDVGIELEGIHGLRALHEEMLDRILAACLLRKRQEMVMKLLEEILGIILDFAGKFRGSTQGRQDSGVKEKEKENDMERLYRTFQKKVKLFITVCKGLQDQKSITGTKALFVGGRRGNEMGNGIGRLVLRFEMNG